MTDDELAHKGENNNNNTIHVSIPSIGTHKREKENLEIKKGTVAVS